MCHGDDLIFVYHALLAEIDSDRRDEARVKNSVRVLIQKAGFADSRVAEGEKFDQIVIVTGHWRHFGFNKSAPLYSPDKSLPLRVCTAGPEGVERVKSILIENSSGFHLQATIE